VAGERGAYFQWRVPRTLAKGNVACSRQGTGFVAEAHCKVGVG